MIKHFSLFFLIAFFTSGIKGTAATYTVTSSADDGSAGTLRWAINQANGNAGADLINFNLGAGPTTITLTSALPSLTDDGTTIDGFDNGGSPGTPNTVAVFSATPGTTMNPQYKVVVASSTVMKGFELFCNNNTIRGLVINVGNGANTTANIGINITGNNNKVVGCYIGTDINSNPVAGRVISCGINISGSNNQVGDGTPGGANLITGISYISSSKFACIILDGSNGATNNRFLGNMLGLTKDGYTAGVGIGGSSGGWGVRIDNTTLVNTVGGSNAGEGNVISGNEIGIYLGNASNTVILGNIIGPAADGMTNLTYNIAGNPGQSGGIYMFTAPNTIIGGNTAGARNIISANNGGAAQVGLLINSSSGSVIKGNYIGIAKDGKTHIAGSIQRDGIYLNSGTITIGGTGAGEGNVISDNMGFGILTFTSGTIIQGNIIGPQADGNTYITGNQQVGGIALRAAGGCTVGGTTASARNIISANLTYGVDLRQCPNNTVIGNYIGCSSTKTNIASSPQQYGVYCDLVGCNSNKIGGYNAGEANTIAFNTVNGVFINTAGVNHNLISRNTIYNTNTPMVKAINLNGSGNDNYAMPLITAASTATVRGTALNDGDTVEVFKTDGGCINAMQFIGSGAVSGGTWSAPVSGVATNDVVIANVRSILNNNTSEFTTCFTVTCGVIATQNTTICLGGTQVLSVFGGTTYSWAPAASLSATTGAIVNATPTTTTTYTVTESSCGAQTTTTVAILSTPPVITVSPDMTICAGSTSVLSASGSNGYNWSPAAGLSSTMGASVMAGPTASTSYTVTETICSVKAVSNITVNPLPTVNVSSNSTICNGSQAALTASGGQTYSWSPGALLNTSAGSSVNAIPTANGLTNFTVTATDANGCSVKKKIIVTVNASPTLSLLPNGSVCTGSTKPLSAAGSNGNYTWSPSTGLTAISGSSNTFTVTTPGIYNYTLTLSNGLCSKYDAFAIAVYALPTAGISGNITICPGGSVKLTASGGNTYLWSNGATGSSVSISTFATTTYSVFVTDINGCSDSASVKVSTSLHLAASPDMTITQGDTAVISVYDAGPHFLWSPASSLTCDTCPSTKAYPASTTLYYVTVTDNNGCSRKDSVRITVKEVCGDIFVPSAFSPNNDGHNDIFLLRTFNNNCFTSVHFKIFDRWGNLVFQTTDLTKGWDGKLNGKEFATDVFVYSLQAERIDGSGINRKGNISLVK